ncbi:hypothetical protein P4S63_25055 [Pseudoalteromonas sp. B193]
MDADILLLTFGWLAYLVPAAIQLFGYLLFKQPHRILQLDYTTLRCVLLVLPYLLPQLPLLVVLISDGYL